MIRTIRRRRARRLAAAGLASALLIAPGIAKGDDTLSHQNIAGTHAGTAGNPNNVYPMLRRGELSGYAFINSINEACANMWATLWSQLAVRTGRSYAGAGWDAYPSPAPGCTQGTDRQFGNFVTTTFSGYTPHNYTAR